MNLKDKFIGARESTNLNIEYPMIRRIPTEEQGSESEKFKKWIGIIEERHIEEVVNEDDTLENNCIATLKYLMHSKALAYVYWTGEGDLKQAEIMYQQWEAYCQLCEAIGLSYKPIMDDANE